MADSNSESGERDFMAIKLETILVFILKSRGRKILTETESPVKPGADAGKGVFPDGAVARINAAFNGTPDRF